MSEVSVKQWIIALILVGVIGFGVGNLVSSKKAVKEKTFLGQNSSPKLTIQDNVAKKSPSQKFITVYVTGEVKNPDVYKLTEDCIVKDAIQKAGGAKEDADLIAINLARKVTDGEEIIVPKKGSNEAPSSNESTSSVNNGKININIADIGALEKLPGIGEVKANAIIQYRKTSGLFKTIHDITRVSGIGEKTFEKIESLITVG